MRLEEEVRGNAAIVRPYGSLRAGETAEALEKALGRAEAQASGAALLDLSNVREIDSTALGVVVGTGRRLHAAGRELYLVGPNERVLLLFQLTKLDAVFPVAPSVEDALSGRS
jgi:anti-sigma B factor antagonist